jgi:TM2 domain-containing membrane protein YozV
MKFMSKTNTHSLVIGYLLWLFGFTGAHRFYFGKPISGCIWFFSFGLCGLGWLFDLILIPWMDVQASHRYGNPNNRKSYNVTWILLTFFGIFGLHRFYMGKWLTGLLWFFTGGLFLGGYLYDLLTLNEQVRMVNLESL